MLKKFIHVYNKLTTIIDTEFEEDVSAKTAWEAVIKAYSKRNLNVAANLLLAFRQHQKGNVFSSAQEFIEYCEKNVPNFKPYKDQLNKYLILL